MRDLKRPDGQREWIVLQAALGINDAGWIVGYGTTADGQVHGVLLQPVPEPSSLVLTVLGTAILLAASHLHGGLRRGERPMRRTRRAREPSSSGSIRFPLLRDRRIW